MHPYNPLVSVIIPTYNVEAFVKDALESVIAQTYDNWELIVVDDGSCDGTLELLRVYEGKDTRIRVCALERNSGQAVARNHAVAVAKGRYIAFLDSDDMWLPYKLERQVSAFQEYEDAAVVFSYYEKISENGVRSGRIVTSPSRVTYDALLYGNVIGGLTGMYDTQKVGKIHIKAIGHEDYAMWLEILKKGYVGVNTCDVQALHRVRSGSVSADKVKAARWQWNIYRNVEKLNVFKATCCFVVYALRGVLKSLK